MLDVREQVRLSFRRLLELCVDSIRYRLLRSLVTVVIIVLAIAFLASIMTEGYLGRAVRDAVVAKTRSLTAYSRFLSQVSVVESEEKMALAFAHLRPQSADFRNLVRWGEFTSPTQAEDFVQFSRKVEKYVQFFDSLPTERRLLLVEENRGVEIFNWLSEAANYDSFTKRLGQMKSVRIAGGLEAFRAFLNEWPAYRRRLATIRRNHAATLTRIAEYCSPEGVGPRLAAAIAAGRVEEFFADLAARGFEVEADEVPHILQGADYEKRRAWAFAQLRKRPIVTGWNRKFQENFSPGLALKSVAESPGRLDWIQAVLAAEGLDGDFDQAKFMQVAREYAERDRLLAAEQQLLNRYGRSEQLGEKTIWLICVSFLVCVVGIANAMLMSVLERFKEIATMKCLGARNETIGFLFVTESTIMGVIGGLIGTMLGFSIVFLRQLSSHGGLLFENFPTGDMLRTLLVCFACSLLLAAVAAIYPAQVAARMAPMEAMRVD